MDKHVPKLVVKLLAYVFKLGITQEGIYRLSGSGIEITIFSQPIEKGIYLLILIPF